MLDARNLLESFEPVLELARPIAVLGTSERVQQALTHLRVKQPQRQRLPIAQLQGLSGVIGMHSEQVASTHPATLQCLMLGNTCRPGVAKELQRRQLCEQ
ncbi:hypothetical protein D3C75_1184940 [compost metagenome]